MHRLISSFILAVILPGCGGSESAAAAEAELNAAPPAHVDSIYPIEEELRRFRATLHGAPTELIGGHSSRDDLVQSYVDALSRSDIASLREMAISPEEFAYLYYPHTHYSAKPYELSPSIVWLQLENYGSRGLARALRRYGGSRLELTGYSCVQEPLVQGDNRIWADCILDLRSPDGSASGLSLFGPVLERSGRFKLVSHANRLAGS